MIALTQAVAFFVGVVGPWRDVDELVGGTRVARPIRVGIALSLVLSALWLRFSATGLAAVYAEWIFLGMFASFIGDLIMARLIPVPSRLIGGMVAFGVGHGFYIKGYASTLAAAGVSLPTVPLVVGLLVYDGINLLGWQRFVRNPAKSQALNVGALLYGAWIAVMAAFALALAVALGGGWWLAALGGVVFILSDFLIGTSEIRGNHIPRVSDWIWLTYIAGQMGIIYASAVA